MAGNSVMLFYLLLLPLLSFLVCPTDSMPNWASCLFKKNILISMKQGPPVLQASPFNRASLHHINSSLTSCPELVQGEIALVENNACI